MRSNATTWLVVIAASALVAHACGYAFGVMNQATYFLQALHRAHPELLAHDWLVSNTSEYHSVFGLFAGWLYGVDDTGTLVFSIVHVVLMVALLCGMFLVVRATTSRATLPIFFLVVGWLVVNGERSVAGSYLWSAYLQPSLIGAVGWIIALAFQLRGRPLAAGIALALGGVFHANFLLLGIGVFGLVELLDNEPGRLRRFARLLGPQLVALAVLAPEIFANAGSSDPDRALWVLVQFHAPLHYKPGWILRSLPEFVRWIALAIVVAPVAAELGQRVALQRLVRWTLIAAAVCVLGTVVMLIPALLTLTRLYIWRLAPFAVLTAQIVVAMAIVATIVDIQVWRRQPVWRAVVAAALLLWIAASAPFGLPAAAAWIVWISVVAIAISAALPVRWRGLVVIALAAATFAMPLWYRRVELVHPEVGIASEGADTDGLYAWARTATPLDAVFMTGPDLYRFRLVAHRAAYADFKSPPLSPDGLVEWHARLTRMTGALDTDKIPTHRKLWADSTGDQLYERARQLGTDFLILDHSPAHDQIAAKPVFANQAYAVFATR